MKTAFRNTPPPPSKNAHQTWAVYGRRGQWSPLRESRTAGPHSGPCLSLDTRGPCARTPTVGCAASAVCACSRSLPMDMRDTDAQTVVAAFPKWLESTITLITLQAIMLDDYLRTYLSFFQNKISYLEKNIFKINRISLRKLLNF